jgi:hypothetical protein
MLTYIMSCHGLGVRGFEGRIGMQNFEKKFTLVETQSKERQSFKLVLGVASFS